MNTKAAATQALRGIHLSSIVFWAIVPFLVLLSFYAQWLLPVIGSFHKVSILSIAWAISFLIVFSFLLFPDGSKNTQTQGLLGLLCTLTLGLPSIALAAFPLVGPPAYPQKPSLDFGGGKREEVDRARFFVVIDISRSFIGSEQNRIKLVSDAIGQIFSEGGVVGSSIRASDDLEVYIFAGKSDMWRTSEASGESQIYIRQRILSDIAQGGLKQFAGRSADTYCPNATDIMTPLSYIVSKLEDPRRPYSFARVLLFSDLVHSIHQYSPQSACSSNSQPTNVKTEKENLRRLIGRIQRLPNAALVAFSAPAQIGPSADEDGDLNIPLRKDFEEGLGDQWQEISLLTEWQNASPTDKLLLPFNLYADVKPLSNSLDIRYIDSPWPRSRQCQIDLVDPECLGDFVLGLRARYPGKKPFRVNLKKPDGSGGIFKLSLAAEETSSQSWSPSKPGVTSVLSELDLRDGVPDDTQYPELLVASPSHSMLYRTHLALSPSKESPEISQARLVLLLLNILPMLLRSNEPSSTSTL